MLTYQPQQSLFFYIPVEIPAKYWQRGVKNPQRGVKFNDSPPPYVQCVFLSHPRTQTSSLRRGGRWHALP